MIIIESTSTLRAAFSHFRAIRINWKGFLPLFLGEKLRRVVGIGVLVAAWSLWTTSFAQTSGKFLEIQPEIEKRLSLATSKIVVFTEKMTDGLLATVLHQAKLGGKVVEVYLQKQGLYHFSSRHHYLNENGVLVGMYKPSHGEQKLHSFLFVDESGYLITGPLDVYGLKWMEISPSPLTLSQAVQRFNPQAGFPQIRQPLVSVQEKNRFIKTLQADSPQAIRGKSPDSEMSLEIPKRLPKTTRLKLLREGKASPEGGLEASRPIPGPSAPLENEETLP